MRGINVAVCKIGDWCVLDPSSEEEECSTASVVVTVSRLDGSFYALIEAFFKMNSFSLALFAPVSCPPLLPFFIILYVQKIKKTFFRDTLVLKCTRLPI